MSVRELGRPSSVVMLCALATVVLFAFGGFELIGAHMAIWPLQIAGLIALVVALRRDRQWWLLAFAPILFAPLAMWVLLLNACAHGDCL